MVNIEDVSEVIGKCSICGEDAYYWSALNEEYRCGQHAITMNSAKGD